ncbi:MFS family permease [Actinoplanes tereljensis]|uniref:MFS transporter n=1 Tax=Paractinoplanes tereljensis TaxID=571912 RepID=A0A919NPD1_9ACTN|nr:MFS transporter [Actinoplanes tereljensis]GIF21795.1 MFS transporter [Actinoplanes tereljensis]
MKYRWVILAVATFTQAAAGFFVQGVGALGVQLRSDLGISAAQLGLLVSAGQFVPLIGLLVAGELLDRFDERWVVTAGAAVVGGALVAGAFAPGYAALLAVLLVVGAGYSTVQPGGSKSVASWFDASRRGTAMGIRQAGLPLGAALASATLPAIATAFGWRATPLTGGLIALLGAAAFLTLYRRPPALPTGAASATGSRAGATWTSALRVGAGPGADAVSVAESGGGAALAAGSGAGAERAVGSRRALLREPGMRRALRYGVGLISVQCGIGLLTVLHLHDAAGMSAGRATAILVAAQGAGVAGRILLAAWSDRAPARRHDVVRVSMLAVAAGLLVVMTPLGGSAVAASIAFVWLGFFGIGWYGPWVAMVAEVAPGRTGFALGLAMMGNQVAIVLVPPLLGLLRDATGGFTVAWGLLLGMTCAALVRVRGNQ